MTSLISCSALRRRAFSRNSNTVLFASSSMNSGASESSPNASEIRLHSNSLINPDRIL